MSRTYDPWIDYAEDAEHSVYHIAKIFKDCSVERKEYSEKSDEE